MKVYIEIGRRTQLDRFAFSAKCPNETQAGRKEPQL